MFMRNDILPICNLMGIPLSEGVGISSLVLFVVGSVLDSEVTHKRIKMIILPGVTAELVGVFTLAFSVELTFRRLM